MKASYLKPLLPLRDIVIFPSMVVPLFVGGLIKELAIKKSFKPDIVFIDYLNICASSRFKGGANINS